MAKKLPKGPSWCSVTEAAEYLGVSRNTIHNMIDAGVIPGYVFGTGKKKVHRRLKISDLEAYIEASRVPAGAA